MAIQNLYPSIRPTLSLDFANTKRLDPRITFTRSTGATYYDGKTVAKAEENLLTYSQEFDNANWATNGTTVSGSVTAPDGTQTAYLISEGTTNGYHDVESISSNKNNANVSSGNTYTLSAYAQNVDRQYFVLAVSNSGYAGVCFDLSAGSVESNVNADNVTYISSSITSVGSGWYRCSLTFSSAISQSLTVRFAPSNTTTLGGFGLPAPYTGTNKSFNLWGAQLEQRDSVTAYTPTTTQPITNYIPVLQTATTDVARFDHDPITGESKGLLIEEQRTNLAVRSADLTNATWVKSNCTADGNVAIAPDGTQSAQLITATTSAAGCYQSIGGLATADYAMSVYVKRGNVAIVSLSIVNVLDAIGYNFDTGAITGLAAGTASATNVGNGWVRLQFWWNCSAGNFGPSIKVGTAGGTVYAWGFQFEVGQFPTSYIPTVASQVTRSADAASMTGTNFSSWYSPGAGSFSVDAVAANQQYSGFFKLTGGSEQQAYYNGSANVSVKYGSVNVTTNFSGTKFATAYDGAGTAAVSGSNVSTSATAFTGTATGMQIGLSTFPRYLNGTIKKLAYYPKRLTNSELVALTL